MTALTRYQKLESTAVWHETPDSQRRDVYVALGEATLVIKDKADMALTHWSLPAMVRVGPGSNPAIFAPGPEDDERLEVSDPDMVDALEKVRRAVLRTQPKRGLLRLWMTAGFLLVAVALAWFWLPGALVDHTARALPEATRQEIGRRLILALEPYSGQPCRDIEGRKALGALQARLFDGGNWDLRVLENGDAVMDLPGKILAIGGGLLRSDGPDVVAGHLLAAAERSNERDPMVRFLEGAGTWRTFRMLTTGRVPDEVLAQAAQAAALGALVDRPDTDRLLSRFQAAQISSRGFGMTADRGGDAWIEMVENDPFPGGTPVPVMSDANWLRLQAICD